MEPWEFELEFLTYNEYDKAINKANGVDQNVETFEVDDDEFKQQVAEFNQSNQVPGEFNPQEWEEVDG